jgi:hypothetical protein
MQSKQGWRVSFEARSACALYAARRVVSCLAPSVAKIWPLEGVGALLLSDAGVKALCGSLLCGICMAAAAIVHGGMHAIWS